MTTVASGTRSATDIIREKKGETKMNSTSSTTPKKASTKKASTKKASGTKLPTAVARLPTTAAKIRALWSTGRWTRLQIAKALDISFQHVYNTSLRPTKDFNPKKFSGPKKS